jgi:hypothetical protein
LRTQGHIIYYDTEGTTTTTGSTTGIANNDRTSTCAGNANNIGSIPTIDYQGDSRFHILVLSDIFPKYFRGESWGKMAASLACFKYMVGTHDNHPISLLERMPHLVRQSLLHRNEGFWQFVFKTPAISDSVIEELFETIAAQDFAHVGGVNGNKKLKLKESRITGGQSSAQSHYRQWPCRFSMLLKAALNTNSMPTIASAL